MSLASEREEALVTREREVAGLPLVEVSGDGWRVAFSTREGGVSGGAYRSLNLGLSVGDDAQRVLENRRRLVAALGLAAADLVIPGQVHGTRIAEVGGRERGRGAASSSDVIAGKDGLATGEPVLPLWVSFADCVPVLVVSRLPDGRPEIALVHAGWRGMVDGIAGEAARLLRRRGGALRAAVIGPSICPACFTVGDEVGERFVDAFPGVYSDGRVDLWAAATAQMVAAGVPASAVIVTGLCSAHDARFFSHRRDRGLTGRQAAIAWLDEPQT